MGFVAGTTSTKCSLVAKNLPELPVSGTTLLDGDLVEDIDKQGFILSSTTPHHQWSLLDGNCVLCCPFMDPPIVFWRVA